MALGHIYLRFAWQAWRLWHRAGSGGALGRAWSPVTPLNFAWHAWHLATKIFVSRGTRGTGQHLSSFRVAGVALGDIYFGFALCVAGVALGDIHLRFAWQACHLRHWAGFHTPLCHPPSLTHHLSHTVFHTPSHTIFHTQLCHTPSFTTPSFTHNFVTHHLSPHHLSDTTLSHTIFHTQLSHTLSFTHNFVTRHLSHTTLSHTHTHTPSFFVTHRLSHTTFSHALFHIQLCHTQLCFTSRSSATSYVFPSFPVPLQHLVLIIGRSCSHVGITVIRSWKILEQIKSDLWGC